MTKDYKNVPRSSDKKTTKRAPKKASGTTKKSSREKKPTPGWVWMSGGLAIGLGVAAIVYFYDRGDTTVKTATQAVSNAIKAIPTPKLPENISTEKEDGPRFDFYTLLPELEVLIPETEIKQEQDRIKQKNNVAYMIQAGSFRAYGEADSLKAQMAMLGIEADIDPVSSKGEQWLRVRVGPFTDKRELNKVRNRLHKNNINTMLVQIKK
ncbi:MAG TPA: SPOR domain-containing protein [Candidatus Tenderia electrophaga]|uniref:SPOR domain-containing protein n=1 Tax=Candidatus Tenderia electrophaga TaxID=1748243 RepID=A0A832N4X0_9GAMM|nr:SPOR domain-containing protein [Candidatus Tenderia electrophaga]